MTRSCGYIGAGNMGAPMIRRLLAAGVSVRVWARAPARLRDLAEAGAVVVDNPAELSRQVDVVMTCVSDANAMRSVVFGESGVSAGAAPGKILVDMSTIPPRETIDMAARLHSETGMRWIDAPVSGGQAGAEAGTLAVMAGGPAHAIDEVRPLLSHLARSVTRVGDSGAGQSVKMLNQSLVAVKLLLIAEVLGLAERMGVDAATVPMALRGGFGDSPLLQQIWPKMASRNFTVTGTLDTLMKDLRVVKTISGEVGAAMPVSQQATDMIQHHIDHGCGSDDISSIFKLYAGR